MTLSEFYGKRIISNEGRILGEVKGILLNFEVGGVSHLLLIDAERFMRSTNPKDELRKSSIAYKRVKKVDETIIVGRE